METILIIILAGVITSFICVKLGINTIIGYLVAGLLLSVAVPEMLVMEDVSAVIRTGITVILFLIGAQFSLKQDLSLFTKGLIGNTIVVAVVTLLAVVLLPGSGLSDFESFLIGFVVSFTSVILLANTSTQLKAWTHSQALLSIPLFMVLAVSTPEATTEDDIITGVIKTVLLLVITYVLAEYIFPFVMTEVRKTGSQELELVFIFGIIAAVIATAFVFSIPIELFALPAGILIGSELKQFEKVSLLIDPIKLLVFVGIGSLFSISALSEQLGLIVMILVLLSLVKIVATVVVQIFQATDVKNSVGLALATAHMGEISILIALLGYMNNWISKELFGSICVAMILSVLVQPLLTANVDWVIHLIGENLKRMRPNLYRTLYLSPGSRRN